MLFLLKLKTPQKMPEKHFTQLEAAPKVMFSLFSYNYIPNINKILTDNSLYLTLRPRICCKRIKRYYY